MEHLSGPLYECWLKAMRAFVGLPARDKRDKPALARIIARAGPREWQDYASRGDPELRKLLKLDTQQQGLDLGAAAGATEEQEEKAV